MPVRELLFTELHLWNPRETEKSIEIHGNLETTEMEISKNHAEIWKSLKSEKSRGNLEIGTTRFNCYVDYLNEASLLLFMKKHVYSILAKRII